MVDSPFMTQAHPSKAQRRLLTAGGGLGVVALAGGAFVLSFDTLRALAVRGGASRHYASLYPWMLDGLVVVVILSILMSRRFRWWSRAVRWLLLLVLVAGAGAAGVEQAVRGYERLPQAWVSGGVAVAPWTILLLGFWLWISMIKQARRMRTDERRPALEMTTDTGLIPGLGDEPRPLPPPPTLPELEPVRDERRPTPLPPAEPAHAGPRPGTLPPARPAHAERRHATLPPGPEHTDPPEEETRATTPPPSPGHTDSQEETVARAFPTGPEHADASEEETRATTLPPGPGHTDPPEEEAVAKAFATGPEHTDPPEEEAVARTLLPTDVPLVGAASLNDTHPDGIKLPDTMPDGIPALGQTEDADADATDRAEDPDVLPEVAQEAAEAEPEGPPSSTFRSSPTPPRD
jgi:Protein of unknown function (DUF2637)